jgi:hypothetical protein
MPRHCQIGRIFRRCHQPVIATCQYCGRDFCTIHTGLRAFTDELCNREVCLAKHEDLKAHHLPGRRDRHSPPRLLRVDGAMARGAVLEVPRALLRRHLRDREGPSPGDGRLQAPGVLCDHCGARLKLWSKS